MHPHTTFAERAISFYLTIAEPTQLPNAVQVVNPYEDVRVQDIVRQFYQRFFSDSKKRIALLGINPGRFGGGTTGIAFTDPTALREYCGIANPFPARAELSSRFIYTLIEAYGGATAFYSQFFLGALYPLALVREGKNYNFYDNPSLYAALEPAIVDTLKQQIDFGLSRQVAICLGKKNADYLMRLNKKHHFFESILTLDHPRFIMQYRLKQLDAYITEYVQLLKSVKTP